MKSATIELGNTFSEIRLGHQKLTTPAVVFTKDLPDIIKESLAMADALPADDRNRQRNSRLKYTTPILGRNIIAFAYSANQLHLAVSKPYFRKLTVFTRLGQHTIYVPHVIACYSLVQARQHSSTRYTINRIGMLWTEERIELISASTLCGVPRFPNISSEGSFNQARLPHICTGDLRKHDLPLSDILNFDFRIFSAVMNDDLSITAEEFISRDWDNFNMSPDFFFNNNLLGNYWDKWVSGKRSDHNSHELLTEGHFDG